MTDSSLQFDKAEFTDGAAASAACGYCRQPLRHNYWSVDGKPACARCKNEVATRGTSGSGLARFVRATVFGSFAGALGAGLWYAIRAITNLEIGLISIVVGLAVGVAVKAGSHGRGGPLYQALAVFLTYTAICSTYVPYIVESLRQKASAEGTKEGAAGTTASDAADGAALPEAAPTTEAGPTPKTSPDANRIAVEDPATAGPVSAGQAAIALVLVPVLIMAFAYAAPFLGGFNSILGLAIIAFGLYEAWKINRREAHAISGPFAVAAPTGAVPASVAPPALG